MQTGHIISGLGHAGLIGWALFGGAFAPTPEPFEVTEVAMISGAEFDALMAGVQAPSVATEVAMPGPPPQDAGAPPPEAETAPAPTPQPEVAEAPPPDPAPDVTELAPPDPADVQDQAPVIAPPPQEQAVLAPELSSRPVPRPAPRVAPEPVAAPKPDTKIDDVVREEAAPQEVAEQPREEQTETAPEEASTEIVTEATEKPSAAPLTSVRPKARPNRPAPQPETQTAAARPGTRDAVKDALAEALGGTNATQAAAPAAPSGPPLTSRERDALRLGVQKCWNVGSLSSDALRTTVVVGVQMTEAGKPVTGSIRMLSQSGGTDASARQAFEAARRAIIRCGAAGFPLPQDKYAQWRDIEMTFNPEKMRIK